MERLGKSMKKTDCALWRLRWPRKSRTGAGNRARSRGRQPIERPHVWSDEMSGAAISETFMSPLQRMTQTTPTCLWNDSASVQELNYSIEHGAVGATCNPVIVLGVLKKELPQWKTRIEALLRERPAATEDEIAWQVVREISVNCARLLLPAFKTHDGRNGRL